MIFQTLSPDRAEGPRQALESRAFLDATRKAAAAGRDAPPEAPLIGDLQVARELFDTIPTINPGGSQWVEGQDAVIGWRTAIALLA